MKLFHQSKILIRRQKGREIATDGVVASISYFVCFYFRQKSSNMSQSFLHPDRAPRLPKTVSEKSQAKRLIVVLMESSLETVRLGSKNEGHYALLNCDDHHHILKKNGRDVSESRPDISHQCLLALLDSPLNKAGLLQVNNLT